MSDLNERDTQTKVKHEILDQYLKKWGFIIRTGLRNYFAQRPESRKQFKGRFIYVDYFAYSGIYTENGKEVYGSPILGVQALDEIKKSFSTYSTGLSPTITAILFEEDTSTFNRLITTLQGLGYANRIKHADQITSLGDGDIAVIKGDSSQYVDRILKFIDRVSPTYSFHFIDPYGTKGVERNNIEKIVSKKGADCIINMMLNPIYRWATGIANKTELNPTEQAHAGNLDKFYGSSVWRDIGQSVESGILSRQEAERQLVDEFVKILHGADPNITVKQIPLQFQDREQTIYHLFLTTHDPTGAFTMNEILTDARIREYDYRVEKRQMKMQPQTTPFHFFTELPDQKRPTEPQPDIDHLGEQIYANCRGRTMKFREILHEMVKSPYLLSDVKEALGNLRKQERATFEGRPSRLTNESEVTFV
jgi:three-Cys-motif partner protein